MSEPDPAALERRAALAVDGPTVVDDTIRARRTSLLVDAERPVPPVLLGRMIEAATWAPNHKRTWPWRFTTFTGDARARLGAAMAEVAEMNGVEPARVAKLRTKYTRSSTVVLVWVVRDPDPLRAREDRDATAAAVQNLLLSATANGLGSYWGSIPDDLVGAVRGVAGVDDRHDPVALVYVGWPTGTVTPPERPKPHVDQLD